MGCSMMAAVRDNSFPCHFWVVEYFTGSRLNVRVTRASNSRSSSSSVPIPPLQEGLGLTNLAGVSAAGAAVLAGVCGGDRLGRRVKCDLVAIWVTCWEQRTEVSGWVPVVRDCFFWLLCPVLSPVTWHECVSVLSNFSSQLLALSSAISHAVLSKPWWGFPFPAAHVSQRVSADSSAVWLLGGRAGHTAGWQ